MDEEHRCVECGLLGIRGDDQVVREVSEECRKSGRPPANHHAPFLCSARQRTFERKPEPCVEQLNEEHPCSAFVRWRMGFTPKEHEEMSQLELFIASQIERDKADRQWREQQALEQRQWQETQDGLQHERHKEVLSVASQGVQKAQGNIRAALIVGGLLFIGTLVASIPNWLAWYRSRPVPPATATTPAIPQKSLPPTTSKSVPAGPRP